MNRKTLAHEIVQIASRIVEVDEKGGIQAPPSREAALRGVREAQAIVAGITGATLTAAAPRMTIKSIPGFNPTQLKAAIDQVVDARQQSTSLRVQFESQLKKIKDLDAKEKKGLDSLRAAAAQMKQKERYLVEAEQGLLEFTAFLQDKRPGVEQMLADPETSKFGDKAGDFFSRVGARLGKKVQQAIADIYSETQDDLSHAANAIRGFKVISKTASIKASTLKKAGLTDIVISVKEWLAGEVDPIAKRVLNFAGNISRWVKGFVERTKMVKGNTDDLLKALNDTKASIDSALA